MQATSRHVVIWLVVPLLGIDIAVAQSSVDEAMSLYRQAIALRKVGQQDAAAEKERLALRLVVHTTPVLRHRVAMELERLGKFGLAASELQRAEEYLRDGLIEDLDTRWMLAHTLGEAGEYLKAADTIRRYIDVREVNPESTKHFESPEGRSSLLSALPDLICGDFRRASLWSHVPERVPLRGGPPLI